MVPNGYQTVYSQESSCTYSTVIKCHAIQFYYVKLVVFSVQICIEFAFHSLQLTVKESTTKSVPIDSFIFSVLKTNSYDYF